MEKQNYIQKIVDQIINAVDIGGLPEPQMQAFKDNMEAQTTRRLGLIIMQNLDKAGLQEYEKLTKQRLPKSEEFQMFLEKYLPDYELKVKEGVEAFIKEIIMASVK